MNDIQATHVGGDSSAGNLTPVTDRRNGIAAHRKELFEPEIDKHHGRIFKLMGDGLLAEFSSIVDAVECAIALQNGLSGRNHDLIEDKQIEVRIGINLGDVIIDGEDRHGEGVVIAARLQQLAEPGGILISGTTFDQVERKLGLEFEYLGEQQVKNIEKPVRLYRVRWRDSSRAGIVPATAKYQRQWARIGTAAVVLLLAAGAVGFWIMRDRDSPPSVEAASMAKMALPLPDKPSIAWSREAPPPDAAPPPARLSAKPACSLGESP